MQIWCNNNLNPGLNGPHQHFGAFMGRNEAGLVKSVSHGQNRACLGFTPLRAHAPPSGRPPFRQHQG